MYVPLYRLNGSIKNLHDRLKVQGDWSSLGSRSPISIKHGAHKRNCINNNFNNRIQFEINCRNETVAIIDLKKVIIIQVYKRGYVY